MANKLVVRRQESQSSCNTTQKINAKFIGIDVHSRLHIISCFTQYQQLKKINKLELNGCKELTHTDKQLNLRSFYKIRCTIVIQNIYSSIRNFIGMVSVL